MTVKIGLVGFGTVGVGFVKALGENSRLVKSRAGTDLKLIRIADLDVDRDRAVDLLGAELCRDAFSVLEDSNIDIVVELVGGIDLAKRFILTALRAGKHVVTANKALLAECGHELFAAAAKANRAIYFEGAVGGGIPLISTLHGALAASRITSIYSIINGTANYILTEMADKDRPFDVVLQDAQNHGYAEADPTFDVEGIDSAHKICLLASTAFGITVPFESIPVEGITKITPEDLQYAAEMGYKIKLLAIAKELGDCVEVRVHPTMVPKNAILASVNGVFNGVFMQSDPLGATFLYGRGAGGGPTGGAVLADVIQLARCIAEGTPVVPFLRADFPERSVKSMAETECSYYLRLTALNQPGVLSMISTILAKHHISIASVIQKESRFLEPDMVPIVLMTYQSKERDMKIAITEIERLDVIKGEPLLIRVEKELE